jgi:hypothetical protein
MDGAFAMLLNIIKNVTGDLKRLSQNGFQECFRHIYSRQQKCVVPQGDHLEVNVA